MTYLEELGTAACKAKYELAALNTEKKNEILRLCAEDLENGESALLAANAKDLEHAAARGMSEAMQDRLRLTPDRIRGISEGIRQVALLPDPVGEILERFERPNGLQIEKVRVPFGVIGIIFESRPNVTADAFSLTFKTGNAVILRGGSDAICTNSEIVRILRESLQKSGVTRDAVQLLTDTSRETAAQFMKMKAYVDVLIPRGGAGLIRSVVENANIPVIETGTGNCHVYVDEDADLEMAVKILLNAKLQRISVCNACESLVVHRGIKDIFLPMLRDALKERVELRADAESLEVLGDAAVSATEEDFGTEYLDYILSVKTVGSVQEAIDHINRYHTGHSDAIVTKNAEHAELFLNGVDSACVYVNASTRFTDGFEFGFGAEIGISTQKLHARGPMGLRELTSYKYKVRGTGQVRG
ncbi:MAG: glutamate-5-semialdehyde dehydrogenase [Lachnospiraceae bacterium]|nr:glutamate-5-semialdehyde dehydrogenase [Lachnospiraceae bacterium]